MYELKKLMYHNFLLNILDKVQFFPIWSPKMDKIEPYLHKSFWDLICTVYFCSKSLPPPLPPKVHVFLKLLDLSKLHVRPLFLPTWELCGGDGICLPTIQIVNLWNLSNERRCSLDFATWKRKKIKSKMKRVKNLPLDLVLIVEVLNHTC